MKLPAVRSTIVQALCYGTMPACVCISKLSGRSAEPVSRLTCNTVPSSNPALDAAHYDAYVAIFP